MEPRPRRHWTPSGQAPLPKADRIIVLPKFPQLDTDSFGLVLARRRSEVPMQDLRLSELGEILWMSARTQRASSRFQLRPHPSAGGQHPTTLAILRHRGGRIYFYDPVRHALQVNRRPISHVAMMRRQIAKVLPDAVGTAILVLLTPEITRAKYEAHQSLMWRDAGALLATLHLAATACGKRSTLIGLLGERWPEYMGLPPRMIPGGILLIGEGGGTNAGDD